jgi:phosphatidylglycerophosphate synthase
MSIPAVILADPDASRLSVAGLVLMDRLIVAAYRAGAENILVVSEKPLPQLKRTAALGIAFKSAAACPELGGPTLILSARLLVQALDLKHLIERRGRLIGHDGTPLPAGVLTEFSGRPLEDQLSALPAVAAEGIAEPVTDAVSAAAAARVLWASLGSAVDGLVDKHFNRPVGRGLSKILVHTSVSPNQVSIFATLLGLGSAWLFAQGDYWTALWGAVLLQVSAIVDCVDGDLARVLFKESPFGKWLDIVGDQVVHLSVFVSIGIGLYRADSEGPVLFLAISAAIGVVLSFVVIARGQLLPESQRNTRLQKLVDAATNRDFSVLLLLLTVLDRLSWFLWVTAIGVHVFWLLALGVQLLNHPVAATLNPDREKRS